MNLRIKFQTLVLAMAIPCGVCLANTCISGGGWWPSSWPKELEGLRDGATTYYEHSGTQEIIYAIPFKSREEFEAAWPHLLSLKSKEAPIILQPGPTQYYFRNFGPTIRAGVLILWPSGPGLLLPGGTRLPAGPPWPESVKSASGVLPEYVMVEDGKWVPAGERDNQKQGFKFRARVDIVLVFDGNVVDTNRVAFPKDAPIVPGRFPNQWNQGITKQRGETTTTTHPPISAFP